MMSSFFFFLLLFSLFEKHRVSYVELCKVRKKTKQQDDLYYPQFNFFILDSSS